MSARFGWQSLTLLGVLAMNSMALADAPATEYAPSTYPENYNGNEFFPAAELRALPAARAQASAAAAELRRAESDLNNAVADVHRSFSIQLRQGEADEREAYDALVSAREKAIAGLKQDDSYKALLSLRQRLADQIEQRSATAPQGTLFALATVKLSYSITATAMEVAAIASDPHVTDARDRPLVAGQEVAKLNDQLDAATHNSQAVLAARKNLEDARIAAVASDSFYQEAAKVANVSMDYAYYLRNHPYPEDVYSPYGGYPQFGYPIAWWTMGGHRTLGRRP
ncbi:MAG TPA: hypothetical protein VKK61_07515 [Tepidisphaeraceae bacterium]|nr:hypothetical protein [Tepidisphaeraceae bacterium]